MNEREEKRKKIINMKIKKRRKFEERKEKKIDKLFRNE
jgi:hypothetical protein